MHGSIIQQGESSRISSPGESSTRKTSQRACVAPAVRTTSSGWQERTLRPALSLPPCRLRTHFLGQAIEDRVVDLPGEHKRLLGLVAGRFLRLARTAKHPSALGERQGLVHDGLER